MKRGNNVTLEELAKECAKYEAGLTKASQSNMELHKAMNLHISNLKILSGSLEDLQKYIPSHDQNICKYVLTDLKL